MKPQAPSVYIVLADVPTMTLAEFGRFANALYEPNATQDAINALSSARARSATRRDSRTVWAGALDG